LASLALLVGICLFTILCVLFAYFLLFGNNSLVGGLYYVCIIFAFSVKMPAYMVQLLPAHFVHVSGSMILAGVLLKLGGYGLLRVFLMLFKYGFKFGIVWVALISVWWSFC
jgi:NADH-ubiquinone oxidoreductase chain 4